MSDSEDKIAIGQSYGDTDTGRKRRRNEDSFVCDPPLFAVADGMGGAQAGELASMLAAQALEQRRVHERANDDPSASGMGTTVTVALFAEADGSVTIGHVGDSRAYRLRGGELE